MRSASCRRFARTSAASRARPFAASWRQSINLPSIRGRLARKKLSSLDLYRIRVGAYRIVYEIHDAELIIAVVKVGHRRGVYGR